jgi:hypothetical protein
MSSKYFSTSAASNSEISTTQFPFQNSFAQVLSKKLGKRRWKINTAKSGTLPVTPDAHITVL